MLGLVVQYFFAVTLLTLAAALVMVAINIAYTETTGVYLFASTNLPAAAFLGLHLLMTDPSTSPCTNGGRAIFGALYDLGYVVLFDLLGRIRRRRPRPCAARMSKSDVRARSREPPWR